MAVGGDVQFRLLTSSATKGEVKDEDDDDYENEGNNGRILQWVGPFHPLR